MASEKKVSESVKHYVNKFKLLNYGRRGAYRLFADTYDSTDEQKKEFLKLWKLKRLRIRYQMTMLKIMSAKDFTLKSLNWMIKR